MNWVIQRCESRCFFSRHCCECSKHKSKIKWSCSQMEYGLIPVALSVGVFWLTRYGQTHCPSATIKTIAVDSRMDTGCLLYSPKCTQLAKLDGKSILSSQSEYITIRGNEQNDNGWYVE